MEGLVLQKWITIRGDVSRNLYIQDQEDWLDLAGFRDVAFLIDVAAADIPGTVQPLPFLQLNLESLPTAEERFYAPIAAPITLAPGTGSTFGSAILSQSVRAASTSPLSRWVRWRINVQNIVNATGPWTVTFRIRAVPGRSAFFVPTDISGCVLWLRSDLGVLTDVNGVTNWNDQSGSGSDATPGGTPRASYSQTGGLRNLPKLTTTLDTQYLVGTFKISGSPTSFSTYTMFSVARYPSSTSSNAAFAGTDNTVASGTGFDQEALATTIQADVYTSGATGTVSTSNLSTLGSVAIYSLTVDTSPTLQFFINGASIGTQSLSTPKTVTKYVAMAGGAGTAGLKGDAYEYIVFNRALTSNELTRVHRYLGGRYAISVP
jgi:hypothetical protein